MLTYEDRIKILREKKITDTLRKGSRMVTRILMISERFRCPKDTRSSRGTTARTAAFTVLTV